jgi:hypothetical protein
MHQPPRYPTPLGTLGVYHLVISRVVALVFEVTYGSQFNEEVACLRFPLQQKEGNPMQQYLLS